MTGSWSGVLCGFLVDVTRVISEAFSARKGIDQFLGLDCLETHFKSLVKEIDTGFGEDQVRNLVQILPCHHIDNGMLRGTNHGSTKVADAALDSSWGGIMDGSI